MDDRVLGSVRRLLAANYELWHLDVFPAWRVRQFASDRGVPSLSSDSVENLWKSGLIRCDVLVSEEELGIDGLECVAEDDGQFRYCDRRQVLHREGGYGGVFELAREDMPGMELYFHPFRLYVLYHIQRVFAFSPSATQYLLYPNGLANLAGTHVEMLDKWTSRQSSADRFEYWNTVSELAICLEPLAYGRVFNQAARDPREMGKKRAKASKQYRKLANELLETVVVNDIERGRGELCRAAEVLDANKLIHVLLRLMAPHERLKLRGGLGGSMLFLCMAEIIRRSAEESLEIQLPEEDELGFGQWMDDARPLLYGTDRILDASPEERRDFLTSMGLDLGVKARCYVEGPTELGALRSAVGEGAGIQFVNLRGQVLARLGKGLSFREDLEGDRRSKAFSVVVLDGDREDYVRALKKAAQEGVFFGVFAISSPDFEFSNFGPDELLEVWLELASRDTQEPFEKPNDAIGLSETATSDQFSDYLKRNSLPLFEKSEAWGEALMAYALEHQQLPAGHAREGEDRPIVVLARQLMIARHAGYERSVAQFHVDAGTGKLVRKDE